VLPWAENSRVVVSIETKIASSVCNVSRGCNQGFQREKSIKKGFCCVYNSLKCFTLENSCKQDFQVRRIANQAARKWQICFSLMRK
jgi:hypothetical protein